VDLDLENGRADFGVTEEINKEGSLEVGNTDRLDQTEFNEFLQTFPGLLDRGLALADDALQVLPSRGIGVFGVDVFESNGEVDVEDVEISEIRDKFRTME